MRPLVLLLACIALARPGDHGEILAILGPDRLAVQYYQLPVVVRLAEIDIPPAGTEAAQARLSAEAGRKSNVTWAQDLGADEAGTPRVYIQLVGEARTLNETLVAAGLARAMPLGTGGRNRERLIAAEAKARQARIGLWAAAPVAAAPAPPAAAPVPSPASPQAPFCAEVDGRHFYPSDAPEVHRLNAKRLVFYTSEVAARKAGKQPWQPAAPGIAGSTLEEARAGFGRGKALVEQAAGRAPSPERDRLYERAFLELSAAMQIYGRLAEARPDDAALGEEMRQCMQMRYGAMKSKRVH